MPNFAKQAVSGMKTWLMNNLDNPYPSQKAKEGLIEETGLSKKQI